MEGSSDEQAGLPADELQLQCHICLAPPTNPVATSCGHLFCWPCLYRWLEGRAKPCPVCRTMLRKDINIVPIFGSHQVDSGDGRDVPDDRIVYDSLIPPRPNQPQFSLLDGSGKLIGGYVAASALHEARVRIQGYERPQTEQLQVVAQLEIRQRDRMSAMHSDLNAMELELSEMRRERAQLMEDVCNLRSRNNVLIREAEERDRRHFEERNTLLNTLNEHIARLQESVARANDHLL